MRGTGPVLERGAGPEAPLDESGRMGLTGQFLTTWLQVTTRVYGRDRQERVPSYRVPTKGDAKIALKTNLTKFMPIFKTNSNFIYEECTLLV